MSMFIKSLIQLFALKVATIRNCGGPGDLASFKSASLYPDPPEPGRNTTVMIKYHMHEVVHNGIQICSSSVNWVPLADETTMLGPLPIGDGTLVMSALFPEISGRLHTRVLWNDNRGNHIMCVEGVYING